MNLSVCFSGKLNRVIEIMSDFYYLIAVCTLKKGGCPIYERAFDYDATNILVS